MSLSQMTALPVAILPNDSTTCLQSPIAQNEAVTPIISTVSFLRGFVQDAHRHQMFLTHEAK